MVKHELDAEEQDLLERFEKGELRTAPNADRERVAAPVRGPQHVQEDRTVPCVL